MAYYNTCPRCGANLDPGECCDCESGKAEKRSGRDYQDVLDALARWIRVNSGDPAELRGTR